jgi:AcrR family transcriptional regulator
VAAQAALWALAGWRGRACAGHRRAWPGGAPAGGRAYHPGVPASDTDVLILDATLDVLGDVGLARLSLEAVAARAGLSRQTLYRRFGNRHRLITATVVREESRLLEEVMAATRREPALEPALRTALLTLLTWTRDHPLLGKLLVAEPEGLLPLLASGDAPVLTAARAAIVEVLGDRLPSGADAAAAADLLARVMLSYAIDPPQAPPADVARTLARLFVHGLGTA